MTTQVPLDVMEVTPLRRATKRTASRSGLLLSSLPMSLSPLFNHTEGFKVCPLKVTSCFSGQLSSEANLPSLQNPPSQRDCLRHPFLLCQRSPPSSATTACSSLLSTSPIANKYIIDFVVKHQACQEFLKTPSCTREKSCQFCCLPGRLRLV